MAWMGWWPLSDTAPTHPDALVTAAAATLLLATVVGEVTLGSWRGIVLALGPAALLAGPPLLTSDSLGIIAWVIFAGRAALGCAAAAGVVAPIGGTHRHLRAVPR